MDKVYVWGTGNIYKQYRMFLYEMVKAGEIEIIALISKDDNLGQKDDHSVIFPSELHNAEYDYIILCASGKMEESIMEDAKHLEIGISKIKRYSECIEHSPAIKKKHAEVVDHQCKVLQEILVASDEQVRSYDWMKQKICEFGVSPIMQENDEISDKCIWGILQVADEFTGFCNFLSTFYIEDAIEVGVYKGRSSYFMCAILMRNNPNLKYICVDIIDDMDCFEQYQAVLPALQKRIPSTSEDYLQNAYDFVFIDADHSYEGSILDYKNVGQYAKKLTAFHDVNTHFYDSLNGGTTRTWNEVKNATQGVEKKVFSKNEMQYGIGCVVWDK